MAKEAIELTCVVMLGILKYVPEVQGVDETVHVRSCSLALVPDTRKSKEMCNDAVRWEPEILEYVPDLFKTEMCERAVEKDQWLLEDIPDHFKTQKMFETAVCLVPSFLQSIPNHLKTQEICDDAVCRDLFFLQLIPDYFVTQQQLKIWYDYNVYYYDDKVIEWYNGHKK